MLRLVRTAPGIVLPDLGPAWLQTVCSWARRPSGRSSVSRRPCVGSEGDLRSLSRCCSRTGSSSCLPHCYERRHQRHRHPMNESGIILCYDGALSAAFTNPHTHTQETNLKHTDKKIYVPGVDPMLIKQKVCASATQTQLMGVHVCFLEKEACQRRRKLTVHRLVLLMFHIHPVIITSRP